MSVRSAVQNPVSYDDHPEIHRCGWKRFQELCADILERQFGHAPCDIYGTEGQALFGIDLLAALTSGSGAAAGQCKFQFRFTPGEIHGAAYKFLKHWKLRWQPDGVERFVMLVVCDFDGYHCQGAIDIERRR